MGSRLQNSLLKWLRVCPACSSTKGNEKGSKKDENLKEKKTSHHPAPWTRAEQKVTE
jgi:hypothetical protein